MWANDKERLEIDTKETQEHSPDVSVDTKKEEQDNTMQTAENKLNELERNIDEMLASDEYKKKYKKELHEMKKEIHQNKDEKDKEKFLDKATKKVEEMRKEHEKQKKEKESNPSLMRRFFYGTVIGGFMSKIGWKGGEERAEKKMKEIPKSGEGSGFWAAAGSAILVAGAFLFGKKTMGQVKEWFAGEKDEEKGKESNNENKEETTTDTKETLTEEKNPEIDPGVKQEWLDALQKSYPNIDALFLEAWAVALVQGEKSFVLDGKTYYFLNTQVVSADQNKIAQYEAASENAETQAAAPEKEHPLQPGEQPEIEGALAYVKKFLDECPSPLYVLSRMIALGFIPSKLYGWRMANRILEKPWDMKVGLMKLIPSMRDRLIREKAFLIANGVNNYDYDRHLNRMEAIQNDIKSGKISSFNDIKTHYPDMMENGPIEKILRQKKMSLEKAQGRIGKKIELYQNKEQHLKALDADMKALEAEAQKKYQALAELDKAAQKDPVKEKQLRQEVTKIAKEYNTKSSQIYAETGSVMKNISNGEIVKYQRQFSTVDKLVKMNGGAGGFVDKVNAKGGRFMLRVGLAGLMFRGATDVMEQGVLSKTTALDAADFAASMVPFAGGAYDIGVAWNGKDLNGRTLSTADRWIRGSVGAVSLVLDVAGIFTFGGGNAASAGLKAGVKTTTKVAQVASGAVKVSKAERLGAKGTQVAANVYRGAKFVSKGLMFGGLTYGVVINAYDITVALKGGGEYGVEKYEAKTTENSTVQF